MCGRAATAGVGWCDCDRLGGAAIGVFLLFVVVLSPSPPATMGVHNLWRLLEPAGRRVDIATLRNKLVAVDASIWLTAFVKAMRGPDGEVLPHAHLLGTFRRVLRLLFHNIRPIFVFDGGVPTLKRRTIMRRQERRAVQEDRHAALARRLLLQSLARKKAAAAASAAIDDGAAAPAAAASFSSVSRPLGDIAVVAPTPLAQTAAAVAAAPRAAAAAAAAAANDESSDSGDGDCGGVFTEVPASMAEMDLGALSALPPAMQKNVVEELRRKQRLVSREKLLPVAADPAGFSDTQVAAFLGIARFNASVDELNAAQASTAGHVYKIASDASRAYVLEEGVSGSSGGGGGGGGAAGGLDAGAPAPSLRSALVHAFMSQMPRGSSAASIAQRRSLRSVVNRLVEGDKNTNRILHYVEHGTMAGSAGALSARYQALLAGTAVPLSAQLARGLEADGDKSGGGGGGGAGDNSGGGSGGGVSRAAAVAPAVEFQHAPTEIDESDLHLDALLHRDAPVPSAPEPERAPTADGDDGADSHAHADAFDAMFLSRAAGGDAGVGSGGSGGLAATSDDAQVEADGAGDGHDDGGGGGGFIVEGDTADVADGVAAAEAASTAPTVWDVYCTVAPPPRQPKAPVVAAPPPPPPPPPPAAVTVGGAVETKEEEEEEVWEEVVAERELPPPAALALPAAVVSAPPPPPPSSGAAGGAPTDAATQAAIESAYELAGAMRSWAKHAFSRAVRGLGVHLEGDHAAATPVVAVAAGAMAAPAPAAAAAAPSPPRDHDGGDGDDVVDVDGELPAVTDLLDDMLEAPRSAAAPAAAAAATSKAAAASAEEVEVATFTAVHPALDAVQAELEAELLRKSARAAARDADTVTEGMREEVIALLRLFGLPYIIAPMEAEAQCAHLEAAGLVEGVITDDSDAFLFGAVHVYRHLFEDGKYVEEYTAGDIEAELGLSRDDLVRSALLLGSDYTDGVNGVGPVNAAEILHAFPGDDGLRRLRDWLAGTPSGGSGSSSGDSGGAFNEAAEAAFKVRHRAAPRTWVLPPSFPNAVVLAAYRNPQVAHVDAATHAWQLAPPAWDALRVLCADRFGWPAARIAGELEPVIRAVAAPRKQTTLEPYMVSYADRDRAARIQSDRLRTAVLGLTGATALAPDIAASRLGVPLPSPPAAASSSGRKRGRSSPPPPPPAAAAAAAGDGHDDDDGAAAAYDSEAEGFSRRPRRSRHRNGGGGGGGSSGGGASSGGVRRPTQVIVDDDTE